MILVNQSCSINFNNSITEQHYFKSFTCENIIGLHARISLIVFLTSYHTRLLNKRNIIFRESITVVHRNKMNGKTVIGSLSFLHMAREIRLRIRFFTTLRPQSNSTARGVDCFCGHNCVIRYRRNRSSFNTQ